MVLTAAASVVVCAAVGGLLAEELFAGETQLQEPSQSVPLAALAAKDQQRTDVTTVLFISRVSTQEGPVYQYLARTPGGGYKTGQVSAETEIRQDATGETARIDTHPHEYASDLDRMLWGSSDQEPTQIIHVPKGTITEGFEVDLNH